MRAQRRNADVETEIGLRCEKRMRHAPPRSQDSQGARHVVRVTANVYTGCLAACSLHTAHCLWVALPGVQTLGEKSAFLWSATMTIVTFAAHLVLSSCCCLAFARLETGFAPGVFGGPGSPAPVADLRTSTYTDQLVCIPTASTTSRQLGVRQ
ncbi:hypothetical protein BGZ61DRAFT_451344 [Ilyonectria robusta]|uniref:uncharacterized protein n=1 Tax=Ilyonectria robusta TaxID=1079257 RepID=UPI001E8CA3FC|nr:uncharacterized protein BGZ61DRAFT_451344 [Ilyonectria robusta]KAH8699801.1 hypothetical protein BGZ61DRAFT_451344 [Ilyonectria robusta]